MENFEEILNAFVNKCTYKVGDIVEGVLVKLSKDFAFVDLGTKREALLPVEELKDLEGRVLFNIGDTVKAQIVKNLSAEGHFLLSVKKIMEDEAWEEIKKAFYEEKPLEVSITKAIKGGFEVVYKGLLTGFLPQSQVGKEVRDKLPVKLPVFIINLNQRSFVVSHRAYQRREREFKEKALIQKIETEGILEGRVKTRVKGGFLLEFDGVLTGFLPLSELTRRRLKPEEIYLKEGDVLRVKVLEWDPQRKKLKVSHRVLEPDPWEGIELRYSLEQRVKGKVVKIENFGAFVELEPGLEGLLPASEISWKKGLRPKDILQEGDLIEVVVIDLKPEERRLILSLKRLEEDPWDIIAKTLKVGDIIKATIKTITDFGLFVEVREGVDGFIHISQIDWDRVSDLRGQFKEGEEVRAQVLELDPQKRKLILSLKTLKPDS